MARVPGRAGRAQEGRRGYAIPTALLLVVFCAVGALVVDLGHARLVQTQLQAVSDAAAHAGATRLDWTEAGLVEARSAAVAIGASNAAHGGPVVLGEPDVETGVWDRDSSTFSPSGDAARVNAVRVLARLDGIGTWFAVPAFQRDAVAASGRATAVRMPPPAACAVLADTDLDAMGTLATDSWFSTEGPYDPATAGAEASLCANGRLDVGGDAEIHGDVVVGRGGEIVVHGSSVDLTGDRVYQGSRFRLPVLDPTDAELHNDNATVGLTSTGGDPWHAGGIRLSGNEVLDLDGGTYYFESLRITGGASLVAHGPVELWVTGDVAVAGQGIVNTSADPHALTLYCTGDEVRLTGTSAFYGSVIAPDADVHLGGTNDYYGIVLGRTVDLSGTLQLHADVSLMEDWVQTERWIALVE